MLMDIKKDFFGRAIAFQLAAQVYSNRDPTLAVDRLQPTTNIELPLGQDATTLLHWSQLPPQSRMIDMRSAHVRIPQKTSEGTNSQQCG